jgi:hypothetical protein
MKYSQSVLTHNGFSWYSDEYKIIYLGIPKTASTSMRLTFKIDKNGTNLNAPLKEKEDYKVFTVIREPLGRFISGVFESFNRYETPPELKSLSTVKDKVEMLNSYLDILEDKGFIETHTTPQSFFLHSQEDVPFKIDRILIFENVVEEFNSMCQEYGIEKALEHRQIGNKQRNNTVLDEIKTNSELMDRIKSVYKRDFEIYNKHTNVVKL